MNRPLAFIDTETNTLADHRMPWEIGLIMDISGRVVEWGIHISDYSYGMEPEAAAVNGFQSRFLQDHNYIPTPLETAVDHLASLLDNAIFVGSNPGFDQVAMKNLFLHGFRQPTWHYRSIDVCTLVAGHLKTEVASLLVAADLMKLEYDMNEMHSALADARLARRVYQAVMTS